MAGKLELGPYVCGDTLQFGWTFTDKETGDPIDLTGTTAWMTVKTDPEDPDALALLQLSQLLDHPEAETGEFTLVGQASESALIPPGRHHYDLQIVWPASPEDMVQTYVLGRIKFIRDITQHTADPEP